MVLDVPFIDLNSQQARIRTDLDERIAKVLDHCGFVLGPEVRELEQVLAQRGGAEFALGLSSGTDALLVALMAAGIGRGDAVIVPSFTYTATAEAIVLAGAAPVFVDVSLDDFNIDPGCLADAFAEADERGLRLRSILAVDLYGNPADYQAIRSSIGDRDIFVLGDAAQSFGATTADGPVGSLADVTATSFYPSKPLGCYGDGGAVIFDGEPMLEAMTSIRSHGRGSHKYDLKRVGLNARLDTIQAAILLSKLTVFDDEIEDRVRVAEFYRQNLTAEVVLPPFPDGVTSAWAQFTIRTDRRDELIDHCSSNGVPMMVFYPAPMHVQAPYKHFGKGLGSLPNSERLSAEVVSLPMNPYLSQQQLEHVVTSINQFHE